MPLKTKVKDRALALPGGKHGVSIIKKQRQSKIKSIDLYGVADDIPNGSYLHTVYFMY